MVSTADGRATLDGRTKGLGNAADRALFHALRTQVDAVMVGAGTARVERYGPLLRTAEQREQRLAEGLAAEPVAVLVSGGLKLPADLPLLADPGSRALVLTASTGRIEGVAAGVEYLRGEAMAAADPPGAGTPSDGGLELRPLLQRLRQEHGVRSVLCEGGPILNRALFGEGLVDELFLSLSATLTADPDAPRIVAGPALPEKVGLDLVWALESEGQLFLRYRVKPKQRG